MGFGIKIMKERKKLETLNFKEKTQLDDPSLPICAGPTTPGWKNNCYAHKVSYTTKSLTYLHIA
jgi:hypothetical protein